MEQQELITVLAMVKLNIPRISSSLRNDDLQQRIVRVVADDPGCERHSLPPGADAMALKCRQSDEADQPSIPSSLHVLPSVF